MPKGKFLGEFELYVMGALATLKNEAYGMAIVRHIEQSTGREVAIGAVYATLTRLEAKGFVETTISAPLPISGGRSRRMARLTASGRDALQHSALMLARMLPEFSRGTR